MDEPAPTGPGGGATSHSPSGEHPVSAPAVFDRAAIATAFGVEQHGLLDAATKERVAQKLDRALQGALEELNYLAANNDGAATCQVMVNILKYQLASTMLERDEYLAIDAVAVPTRVPSGHDPMILFNVGAIGETRVGVMFPIAITPRSDLDYAKQLANEATATAIDVVVQEFNSQDIETRRGRITDMVRAQAEISSAMLARARGEISLDVLRERTEPWLNKKPPRGTAIDREGFLLYRL